MCVWFKQGCSVSRNHGYQNISDLSPAGPPGTGKTFLGVQIAKHLLYNTARSDHDPFTAEGQPVTGPLLLVAYTNHALNEFMLDLIKGGISKKGMVRLGSGCAQKIASSDDTDTA